MRRRKIRHHDIGASQYSPFPSVRSKCGQGSGSRYQCRGMHQPEDRKQLQRQLHISRRKRGKRSIVMRKKRSHAYHLRLKPFDEENVFYQMVHRLVRTAHHDSGSHLIAYLFQPVQALQPMGKGHLRRMKPVIMPFVAGFVPQQIAVGTCQEETFVGFPRFLAQG